MAGTIHNPARFEPKDYEVRGYFDNKPPEFYYRMDTDTYRRLYDAWKEDGKLLFGPDWVSKVHRCTHCGNSLVRYVAAAVHRPTGEIICFGSQCVERLHFEDKHQFRLKHIRSHAMNMARAAERAARLKAYLEQFPAVAALIEAVAVEDGPHARNGFIRDVLGKLQRYGEISDRQREAILKSAAKDLEYKARREREAAEPKGEAPEGRTTVTGTVVGLKWKENDWGGALKMTVKLDNNARVWATAPAAYDPKGEAIDFERGDRITFTATFERAKDDPSFAFGKRPHFKGLEPAAVAG